MGDKFTNRFRDADNLFRAQLRKHRQGKHFERGVLGMRKIAGLVA